MIPRRDSLPTSRFFLARTPSCAIWGATHPRQPIVITTVSSATTTATTATTFAKLTNTRLTHTTLSTLFFLAFAFPSPMFHHPTSLLTFATGTTIVANNTIATPYQHRVNSDTLSPGLTATSCRPPPLCRDTALLYFTTSSPEIAARYEAAMFIVALFSAREVILPACAGTMRALVVFVRRELASRGTFIPGRVLEDLAGSSYIAEGACVGLHV